MGSALTQGILAEEAPFDVDPGEAVADHRKLCDFLVGEPGSDRQAIKPLALLPQALETPAVPGGDIDNRRERIDGGLGIRDLGEGQLERIGGVVTGEHHAVAVEDEAAAGLDRHHEDAVVLGPGIVVPVLNDLQVYEACEQDREGNHDDGTGDAQSQLEVIQLALGVLEFGHDFGTRRRESGNASGNAQAVEFQGSIRSLHMGRFRSTLSGRR